MTRLTRLQHKFVEYVPEQLEEGVVYVSIAFDTVLHSCCCGCGSTVSTPLHPSRWKLTYNGETVSLSPSIGSWSLPCRSHYWIDRNEVRWARQWTEQEIASSRQRDRHELEQHYAHQNEHSTGTDTPPDQAKTLRQRLVTRLMWWR